MNYTKAQKAVNKKVEIAQAREYKDDHLENHEVSKLVEEYKAAYPNQKYDSNYMTVYYSLID